VLEVHFAQARLYDAGNKRFAQTDPIGGSVATPLSLNPYLYCQNDPVDYIDPTGKIMAGDEHLPAADYAAILALTAAYNNTTNPATREALHQEAVYIRNNPSQPQPGPPSTPGTSGASETAGSPTAPQGYPGYAYGAPFPYYSPVPTAYSVLVESVTRVFPTLSQAEVFKTAAQWLDAVYAKAPAFAQPSNPTPPAPANPLPQEPTREQWLHLFGSATLIYFFAMSEAERQRAIDAPGMINYNGVYFPSTQQFAYTINGIPLDTSQLNMSEFDPVEAMRSAHSPVALYEPELNAGVGLDSVSSNVRDAFGSDAKITTLTEDRTVYRYYGGSSQASSNWFTPNQEADPISKLALPPGNTAQYMDTIVLPAGTRVIEGTVAAQKKWSQPGGGYQYYVLP
jgi:hypothetical protein